MCPSLTGCYLAQSVPWLQLISSLSLIQLNHPNYELGESLGATMCHLIAWCGGDTWCDLEEVGNWSLQCVYPIFSLSLTCLSLSLVVLMIPHLLYNGLVI